MVKTVNEAFDVFLSDYVNLNLYTTTLARSSRDWLLSQIHSFPAKDSKFPNLYSERDIFFGSFARRTKKRELDDIDIMIALNAEGSTYHELNDRIEIYISESAYRLKALCHDNTSTLNSRKVINSFITYRSLIFLMQMRFINFHFLVLLLRVNINKGHYSFNLFVMHIRR